MALTTEVWSLNFLVKGKRLCFITRTPEGEEKRYWVDMPSRMAAAVSKAVNEHLEGLAEDAALTPEQLREKYQETMGS